ncbi:hypothetical protein B0H14DRAFT_3482044 [Mycena olivaceomarginata]|nr:hypothetical protein B0H14DRAFT_3482044 [Mycena olivaceomarginata]
MAAASPSIEEDLETLLTAIKNLPASAQSGRRSDPLGIYLTPGLTKSNNSKPAFPSHKDSAYFVFNHQWEHVFQKQPGDPDHKLQKLVSSGRGMHGLILAHAWAKHVTWDILAIPGVSISVECLFSSLKHTLSDARSSMTAETASVDIVTMECLKSGLAEGVNYTDFIKIHEK